MNHFGSHFWRTTARVLISVLLCLSNCYVCQKEWPEVLAGDVYCSNGCEGSRCGYKTIECDGCTVFGDSFWGYDLIL